MVTPAIGQVLTVAFPFSDLSSTKMRPALVLADAGRGDWLLCQITSQPFGDSSAIEIQANEVGGHGLKITSFARPLKLFTANHALLRSYIGDLNPAKHLQLVTKLTHILTPSTTH